jgi:uncharacterized protein YndB with AHSA1/START domain
MSEPQKKPSFVYVTYIASTPEKVWAALTDARFTVEYWAGRKVESDWKVGSPVYFRTGNPQHDSAHGYVLEIEPGSRLVTSWVAKSSDGKETGGPKTKVTYLVERAGSENVKLTVIHEEHEPGSEVKDDVRQGWPAVLSSLKSYLETGSALAITKSWAGR